MLLNDNTSNKDAINIISEMADNLSYLNDANITHLTKDENLMLHEAIKLLTFYVFNLRRDGV